MAREYERWENNGYDTTTRSSSDNIERRSPKPKRFKGKYIFIGFILFLFAIYWFAGESPSTQLESEEKDKVYDAVDSRIYDNTDLEENAPSKHKSRITDVPLNKKKQKEDTPSFEQVENEEATYLPSDAEERVTKPTQRSTTRKEEKDESELSTLEILERRNHAEVVKQAKRAGVSTEGSTLEIMERINHAEVVKQAKRAGVSAEGSTLEIMERINHAEVVKQAKRAGVSTEGSTLEIMERINHAEVVKQAKRAGVSTEGSTFEIMERINRKELERYK